MPGAVAGVLLDEWAETVFRSPVLVALMMALMGVVLWFADRRAGTQAERPTTSRLQDALLIGLAQALRDRPGHVALGRHDQRGALPRPAARGRGALQLPAGAADHGGRRARQGAGAPEQRRGHGPGARSACSRPRSRASLAIRVLLGYVRTRDYVPFAIYRFAFAALVWGVLLLRVRALGLES